MQVQIGFPALILTAIYDTGNFYGHYRGICLKLVNLKTKTGKSCYFYNLKFFDYDSNRKPRYQHLYRNDP